MKRIFAIILISLALVSLLSLSAFAADTGAPDKTAAGYDNFTYIGSWKYHYTIDVLTQTGYTRYVIYTDSTIEPKAPRALLGSYMSIYITNDTGSGFIKEYTYSVVDDSWTEGGSHSGATEKNYNLYNAITIKASDLDIYDLDRKEVVFQQTPPLASSLAQTVGAVGERTLTLEIRRLTPTMSILVLCGVGCLALLILLAILPRVLHKYL